MVYLGAIVTANGSSVNNTTTATPFTISFIYPRLLIVTPTAASATFYTTVATGSSLTAATTDLNVADATSTQIQCPIGSPNNTVVAIRGNGANSAGASVSVYGLFGPATN